MTNCRRGARDLSTGPFHHISQGSHYRDRHYRRNKIEQINQVFAHFTAVEIDRNQHPQKATMKRHAALPNPEQPQRIIQQLVEAVEQTIADTPAENDTAGRIENEVIDLVTRQRCIRARRAAAQQPPGGDETHQVHQAIPVHF